MGMFAVVGLIEAAGLGHFFAFTPLYLRTLHVPTADIPRLVGLLDAIPFALGLPFVPFWGVWADRYSRKLIIVRSAALETVMFFLMGASSDLTQFAGAVAVAGLILGNTGVMFSAQTEITPRERLGFALAVVSMAGPLGIGIGPAVGGLIADHFGIRTLFFLDSGLSLGATLWIAMAYREQRRPTAQAGTWAMVSSALRAMVLLPAIRLLFLFSLAERISTQLMVAYMPVLVDGLCRGTCGATAVGVVVSAGAVAVGAPGPAWGAIGDRLGRGRVLVATAGLAPIAIAALALSHTIPVVAGLYVAEGALIAGVRPIFYTLLATRSPEPLRSAILNLAFVPLYLGGTAGPVLGAALTSVGIRTQGLFLVAAGIMATSALMAVEVARAPTDNVTQSL